MACGAPARGSPRARYIGLVGRARPNPVSVFAPLDYRNTTMATCTTQISTAPVLRLLETISLYLHIPFCHTRCHYCDFNTYARILPFPNPSVQAFPIQITPA